jgi:hypothetical protein
MTTTVFVHRQVTSDHFRLHQSLIRKLEEHSLISVSLKLENSFKLILHLKECTNIIIKIYNSCFFSVPDVSAGNTAVNSQHSPESKQDN